MSPEVQEVLDAIGYQHAVCVNPSLFFISWEPGRKGGLLFSDKKEAAQAVKSLAAIDKAIRDLPDSSLELLNDTLKTSRDWDFGRDPIGPFWNGLLLAQERAKRELKEVHGSGRGRPRAVSADRIAERMAEIYVLGLGEMPTFGSDPVTNKPNTRYSKAVSRVLELTGISCGWVAPCRKAVSGLRDQEKKRYEALMYERQHPHHERLSIFEVKK